jgi:hypothetical protein
MQTPVDKKLKNMNDTLYKKLKIIDYPIGKMAPETISAPMISIL